MLRPGGGRRPFSAPMGAAANSAACKRQSTGRLSGLMLFTRNVSKIQRSESSPILDPSRGGLKTHLWPPLTPPLKGELLPLSVAALVDPLVTNTTWQEGHVSSETGFEAEGSILTLDSRRSWRPRCEDH